MIAATAPAPAMIPDPPLIRRRLYQLRTEARLLARLLRIAEDREKVLPPHEDADAPRPAAGRKAVANG